MTQTQTNAIADEIVAAYTRIVHFDGTADTVLASIAAGEWDVLYDLLNLTWVMGLRSWRESAVTQDAWWDAMVKLLPQVAASVQRGIVTA